MAKGCKLKAGGSTPLPVLDEAEGPLKRVVNVSILTFLHCAHGLPVSGGLWFAGDTLNKFRGRASNK